MIKTESENLIERKIRQLKKKSLIFINLNYLLARIPLFNPNNNFKLLWDISHMIVIIIYLFLLPIEIAY